MRCCLPPKNGNASASAVSAYWQCRKAATFIPARLAVPADCAFEEGARLDAALEDAVGAYADPWEEAASPVHPTQFAGALAPATLIEELIGGR